MKCSKGNKKLSVLYRLKNNSAAKNTLQVVFGSTVQHSPLI